MKCHCIQCQVGYFEEKEICLNDCIQKWVILKKRKFAKWVILKKRKLAAVFNAKF